MRVRRAKPETGRPARATASVGSRFGDAPPGWIGLGVSPDFHGRRGGRDVGQTPPVRLVGGGPPDPPRREVDGPPFLSAAAHAPPRHRGTGSGRAPAASRQRSAPPIQPPPNAARASGRGNRLSQGARPRDHPGAALTGRSPSRILPREHRTGSKPPVGPRRRRHASPDPPRPRGARTPALLPRRIPHPDAGDPAAGERRLPPPAGPSVPAIQSAASAARASGRVNRSS